MSHQIVENLEFLFMYVMLCNIKTLITPNMFGQASKLSK